MAADKIDDKGITAKKEVNFSDWYTQAVIKAELADYGPVKGTIAFRPASYALWEKLQEIFNAEIKKTGHKNAYFPMLIPESLLTKEAEHFKGFVPEVFWATKEGNDDLSDKLALRPTSETIIYYFFSKWIRSWRDLPLLLNQWCNVLRAEIKDTKPFIRTSEFLWQEGHTAHETDAEAEKEVFYILNTYKEMLADYFAIPTLSGKKSESEKFAGAKYTTALESMMPDGKALQMATSHNLGQNFSKPFDITFQGRDSQTDYVHTTSWGISTRVLGALIMIHGDDKGIILPPKIAPVQVVIVPILGKPGSEKAVAVAEDLRNKLEGRYAVVLDSRPELSPGYKFNEWELKGVPVRLEIGPKDVEKKEAVLVRRDDGRKESVPLDLLSDKIGIMLDEIQSALYIKANKLLNENTHDAKTYAEFKDIIAKKGGFVEAYWCESETCEKKIKEETSATNRLVLDEKKSKGKCIYCGKATETKAYFAKAY